MWGGRFAEGPAAVMREINASLPVDKRMWRQDIAGSRAHARMLADRAVVDNGAAHRILDGLDQVAAGYERDGVPDDPALEDIHMLTEARLADAIGPDAGRLHTARSRNDQVATDFRLWVRDAIDATDAALRELIAALLDRAAAHADAVMPGFTHLQSAQPVTLGHHLMAYVAMLARARALAVIVDHQRRRHVLGGGATAGEGGHEDAVLRLDGADGNGIEQAGHAGS